MRENPRHSLDTIRFLLVQYLEGMLDTDQLVEVEMPLERNPIYQRELFRLQKTQGILKQAFNSDLNPDLSGNTDRDDIFWKHIERELQEGSPIQPTDYGFEFISAYYDGALTSEELPRSGFEAQLFHNPKANRMLSDIRVVSETIRQWGYRLEGSCTPDLVNLVMDAYKMEQSGLGSEIILNDSKLEPHTEMLSAFVDQELSTGDVISLNRLIEQDVRVREQLSQFNQVSDMLRDMGNTLQEQAPVGFWKNIECRLQAEQAQSDKASPFQRRAQLLSLAFFRKTALPSAAIALLVFLFTATVKNANILTPLAAHPEQSLQLASVPLGSVSGLDVLKASNQDALYAQTAASEAAKPKLTHAADTGTGWRQGHSNHRKTPSSEEYLFRSLKEQASDTDIFSIYEK